MFTGIVEEIGTIRAIRRQGNGVRLSVGGKVVMDDLRLGDSVSINGACQTVVNRTDSGFDVEAVEETLSRTTLGLLKTGASVNLERAMQLGGRLGGHLVQGHVDTVGTVISIEPQTTSWQVWIEFPSEFARYVIPTGSICLNGVSLTSARVNGNRAMVAVIPHTWKNTVFHLLSSGDSVNIEFDVLGKYIEKLLAPADEIPTKQTISKEWLEKLGY